MFRFCIQQSDSFVRFFRHLIGVLSGMHIVISRYRNVILRSYDSISHRNSHCGVGGLYRVADNRSGDRISVQTDTPAVWI